MLRSREDGRPALLCGEKKAPLRQGAGRDGSLSCGEDRVLGAVLPRQRPPDAEGSRGAAITVMAAISAAWRSMRRGWAASAKRNPNVSSAFYVPIWGKGGSIHAS